MALNVAMYSPRLPLGSKGPFIQTGAVSDRAGIAGLIGAGLEGWQRGREQKRANTLQGALAQSKIETERAQQDYYRRPVQARQMDPQQELMKWETALQGLYKPIFPDPEGRIDPTTRLLMRVGLVDPTTGRGISPKVQALHDHILARIEALQGGGGGQREPTGRRVETWNQDTGEQFINGAPTGLASAVGQAAAIDQARTAANARFGSPGGQVGAPRAMTNIRPSIFGPPTAPQGLGQGASIASRVMTEQGAPATGRYKVGDVVRATDGRKARVVGFDQDGEPLVEEIQ
jgi:hypothetical protein